MKVGSKHSKETKEKMKGRLPTLGFTGRKHSEESCEKLREAMKGKNVGEKNPRWKGGRRITIGGYIWIYSPTHPYANNHGCVMEHRLVMETHLGRILLPTEVCHHINGIKDDNRIENLMLFSGIDKHTAFHRRSKKL